MRAREPAVAVIVFAVLAGLFVALRIMLRGELWLDRTFWLVACAAFGGAFAALACVLPLWPRFLSRPGIPAFAARAFLFAIAFTIGMMIAYAFYAQVLSGQFEPNPDRPIRGTIIGTLQVMVLFLISSPAYLLPWPLPVLAALAAWLIQPQSAGKIPRSS